MSIEINFDGLIGPTHNYAGLSFGNVASELHQNQTSYPKKGALQGLEKMKSVASLGVPQFFLPPIEKQTLIFFDSLVLVEASPG